MSEFEGSSFRDKIGSWMERMRGSTQGESTQPSEKPPLTESDKKVMSFFLNSRRRTGVNAISLSELGLEQDELIQGIEHLKERGLLLQGRAVYGEGDTATFQPDDTGDRYLMPLNVKRGQLQSMGMSPTAIERLLAEHD